MRENWGVLVVLALVTAVMIGCEGDFGDSEAPPPHPSAEAMAGKWQGVILAEEGCQVARVQFEMDARGRIVGGWMDFGNGPHNLTTLGGLSPQGRIILHLALPMSGGMMADPGKWQLERDDLTGESTTTVGNVEHATQFNFNRVREQG